MPTKVRVAVRIRPVLKSETEAGHAGTRVTNVPEHPEVVLEEDDHTKRAFKFDQVLPPSTSQSEVFDRLQMSGLIGKVAEGYNATVFAYGQTSSGKTYTMEGYEYTSGGTDKSPKLIIKGETADYGLVQRSINEVYRKLEQRSQGKLVQTSVSCSFMQIYNEKIHDLLNIQQSEAGLRIRWSKEEQFAVENLYSVDCPAPADAVKVYNYGISNRIMATHNLNIASSRSHTIFTITVKTSYLNQYNNVITGKLQLVDLAGSEKTAQTGNVGKHFKESIDINKSLFALRKVIMALSEGEGKRGPGFVPYRDSKLTSLLKHCLGGNSFCLMIACITPVDAYFEETLSTLTYAAKASQIVNDPTINEDPRVAMIVELNKKIHLLEQELNKANEHISWLSQLAGEKIQNGPVALPMPKPKGGSVADPESTPADKRRTDNNNSFISVKEEKKKTTAGIEKKVDAILSGPMTERLVESVNMVKELLLSNRQLREIIDQKSGDTEKYQNEVTALQLENQDFKDKIDVLTRLVSPPNADDIASLDPRDLFAEDVPCRSTTGTGSGNLAKEVLDLRRANRTLEDRVRQLEKSNTQITKGLANLGNIEPAKPSLVTGSKITKHPNSVTKLRKTERRGKLRSDSAALEWSGGSFCRPEVQVTKNVWAPTTIYAIGGSNVSGTVIRPRLSEMGRSESNLLGKKATAGVSQLSEVLNSRMKLYQKNT